MDIWSKYYVNTNALEEIYCDRKIKKYIIKSFKNRIAWIQKVE